MENKEVQCSHAEQIKDDCMSVKNDTPVRSHVLVAKEDLLDVPTFLRRQESSQQKSE